jgi:manganese/zinc/iron transport system ATP- binding protein
MNIQIDNPVLEVHDLTVSYDKKPVLWDVDFTIPYGNLVGIIGPNGAGKSTLIKAIMNLVPKGSGYVKLYNDSLENVLDVVLMGRYGKKGLLKSLSKKDKEIAYESLKRVNMLDFANRQISQLSGGQQQRTFLARALAQEADLYLMDEPFAGVDAATERSIVDLLLEMRKEGKTIIVVHHDLQSAIDYFDWTLLLNTRLVASGPTEKVFTTELLQETYGGKLTLLSKIGDLMKEKQFPARENK